MIALRAVESADGDALHAIFTEPGVRRFLFDDIELTRAETQEHVDAACAQGAWTIRQDGEIVGLVALRPVGADRELIVALSERCWGSGARCGRPGKRCSMASTGWPSNGSSPRSICPTSAPIASWHAWALRRPAKAKVQSIAFGPMRLCADPACRMVNGVAVKDRHVQT